MLGCWLRQQEQADRSLSSIFREDRRPLVGENAA